MNPTIDTVVFDLGNVLIRWNPRNLYHKLFDNEQDMETFLSEVCSTAWNERQDAGRHLVQHDAEREQVARRPHGLSARLLWRHVRHGA